MTIENIEICDYITVWQNCVQEYRLVSSPGY